ncbi:MAG: tetratricopeptide repeat protein [Nitrospinota bacterium]
MAAKNDGNLKKAIDFLDKAYTKLDKFRNSGLHKKILAALSELHIQLGNKAAKRGDHSGARNDYGKAREWAWYLSANFNNRQWLDKANRLWNGQNKLIKERKLNAIVREGRRYLRNGKWDEAIRYFEGHRKNFPNNKNIQQALQEAYAAKAEADRAQIAEEERAKQRRVERAQTQIHGRVDNIVGRLNPRARKSGGTAIEQLIVAEKQGGKAKLDTSAWGEPGASDSRQPFDLGPDVSPGSSGVELPKVPSIRNAGPVAIAKVIKALDRKIHSLDREIDRERNLEKKTKLLEEQIYALDKQSEFLEQSIKKEKDPIKRSKLINKQTSVNSKKRTREIELIDVPVRPPK